MRPVGKKPPFVILAIAAAVAGAAFSWWLSYGRAELVEAGGENTAAAPQVRPLGLPEPPAGAHVILPPDALQAIDRPVFVPALRARLDPESPMVLVRGKSEERAYSLRLLNQHEIVNDVLDGEPIAVTW